jgi:hypothetical protein
MFPKMTILSIYLNIFLIKISNNRNDQATIYFFKDGRWYKY